MLTCLNSCSTLYFIKNKYETLDKCSRLYAQDLTGAFGLVRDYIALKNNNNGADATGDAPSGCRVGHGTK